MSLSLESAVRTCKVNTGWANRLQSDRFLNPSTTICPLWSEGNYGVDTAGRTVCRDSYMTKSAGCNSALDRVTVENAQRPQYSEYITLDAQGIDGYFGQQIPYVGGSGMAQENYQQHPHLMVPQGLKKKALVENYTAANAGNNGGCMPQIVPSEMSRTNYQQGQRSLCGGVQVVTPNNTVGGPMALGRGNAKNGKINCGGPSVSPCGGGKCGVQDVANGQYGKGVHEFTGQFGMVTGFRSFVEPNCCNYPLEYAQQQMAQQGREEEAYVHGARSRFFRRASQ